MIVKEYEELLTIEKGIIDRYSLRNTIYFDIEVTSLNPKLGFIWCIALGYIQGEQFVVKQYLCESLDEEKELVLKSLKLLNKYENWATFNGKSLDEPYIIEKAKIYKKKLKTGYCHYDLYRMLAPYAKSLELKGCGLKNFERSIGINRVDQIDGEQSKVKYKEYLDCGRLDGLEEVLLHNCEDVLSLPYLFKIHDFIIENNVLRGDAMSIEQKRTIKNLMMKKHLDFDINYNNISKKCAKKIIYCLNQRSITLEDIASVIRDTY